MPMNESYFSKHEWMDSLNEHMINSVCEVKQQVEVSTGSCSLNAPCRQPHGKSRSPCDPRTKVEFGVPPGNWAASLGQHCSSSHERDE